MFQIEAVNFNSQFYLPTSGLLASLSLLFFLSFYHLLCIYHDLNVCVPKPNLYVETLTQGNGFRW